MYDVAWIRRRGRGGQLVKVGAKILCRDEKITALEVVTGNVNVGNLLTTSVG